MIARPLLLLAAAAALCAVDPTIRPLLDLKAPAATARLVASAPAQTTISRQADGIAVAIAPGASQYPGVAVKPEGKVWDCALTGHVEAGLVNTGSTRLRIIMRIDNDGDWKASPWSTGVIDLEPGASGTLRVYYGWDWGRKAFALDPARITQAFLFIDKSAEPRSFRLTALACAGPPGEQPPLPEEPLRVVPEHGLILGPGVIIDAAKQVDGGGHDFTIAPAGSGQSLTLAFAAGQGGRPLRLRPAAGRWNLRSARAHGAPAQSRDHAHPAPHPRGQRQRGRRLGDGGGGAGPWRRPGAPRAVRLGLGVERREERQRQPLHQLRRRRGGDRRPARRRGAQPHHRIHHRHPAGPGAARLAGPAPAGARRVDADLQRRLHRHRPRCGNGWIANYWDKPSISARTT